MGGYLLSHMGGTYLSRSGWGVPTFPGLNGRGGTYLPGGGVLTFPGLDGGYLPSGWGVPTFPGLDRGYLP